MTSVIIPAFNAEAGIERAMRSVYDQEGAALELIVVDDGSSDRSAARAEALARRSAVPTTILRQKNAGPSAARNAGAAAARGEYLAFLDADDEWLPGKIRSQTEILEARPDLLLLSCTANGRRHKGKARVFEVSFRQLLLRNSVVTSGAMIRAAAFRAAGGFDPARRLSEDYELWLRVAAQGPAAIMNEALVRRSAGGASSRLWPMERGELETYRILRDEGRVGGGAYVGLRAWSLAKHLLRQLRAAGHRERI